LVKDIPPLSSNEILEQRGKVRKETASMNIYGPRIVANGRFQRIDRA
jgi:hypothetical protein